MAIEYVESFKICGHRFGIEDYTQPGEHFFPESAKARYQLWHNGCGISNANTIQEARKIIFDYAVQQLRVELDGFQREASARVEALDRLNIDPFNLGRFRT